MRQRGGNAQPSDIALSAAAAAARASSLSKRRSTQWRKVRGCCIAAGCFFVCVVLYVCLAESMYRSSPQPLQRRVKPTKHPVVDERDVAALQAATSQVVNLATLPALDDLVKSAAELGAVYAQLLELVVAAQEVEDSGRALHELGVSQDHLSRVSAALRHAADVIYSKLKAMLLQEANAELHMAPTSLVRTTYGWMLSNIYLYSAVLPEYYLLHDDSANHALVLLRSINLLSWSPLVHTVAPTETREDGAAVLTYDLFNWSGGAACRRGPLGHLAPVKRFCESSFSSWSAVAHRVAATYEELIALFPSYAPLRLHYAVSFAFLAMGTAADANASSNRVLEDHAARALKVIRTDRSHLDRTHRHADAAHGLVLALLEAFLTPVGLRTEEQNAQLITALREWDSCAGARAALLETTDWPGGVFPREYRVPLLRDTQLLQLLATAQLHLGNDHAALQMWRSCLRR
ncbi:hypothetical protein LSCM1_00555 [Leishmania martiniquensis]|uniref:Transmembrane protein n=1 Tax=Leishmania martiniquensis TaxID=1580590 RepID=A0A836GC42_9TRYP|nr:hypothetical protein LSCM1_00555 [Leishmania martiniquensis]